MTLMPSFSVVQFQSSHPSICYIYACISNLSLALMQACLKVSSTYISPLHSLALRGFFLLVLNSFIIKYGEMSLNVREQKTWKILMKRMLLSSITVSMYLAPLKYLPAGTVNALFNTGPIIVCFVEAYKYGKPLNRVHFALTLISFTGVLLVIQPDFLFTNEQTSYQQYKWLMILSLVSAFTNSFSMLYLHDLKGLLPSTIVLHYFYIGQCLFNSLAMTFQQIDFTKIHVDTTFYLSIFGLVIFAYLCQNFMTRAIMLKKPSFIMPFGYITIVGGTALDYVVFGQGVDWLVIIGMVLTSSGLMVKLIVNDDNQKPKQIDPNNNSNGIQLNKLQKKIFTSISKDDQQIK